MKEKEKKKGSCLKTILIIILVIIILAAIGSVFSKDKTPKKVNDSNAVTDESQGTQPSDESQEAQPSDESQEAQQQQEEKTVFTQGETAEMNDIQVTLVNYTESSGSEFNVPSDGNVFVLINFDIANNSDSELAVSSMASFEAYADDYALNYSLGAMIEKPDNNQLDGTVAPGKKMNGWIGYEVPSDWSNIEIHFTDNVWSNNKFIFEISK